MKRKRSRVTNLQSKRSKKKNIEKLNIYWNLPNIDQLVGSKCHRIGKRFDWNLRVGNQNCIGMTPKNQLEMVWIEMKNQMDQHFQLETSLVNLENKIELKIDQID